MQSVEVRKRPRKNFNLSLITFTLGNKYGVPGFTMSIFNSIFDFIHLKLYGKPSRDDIYEGFAQSIVVSSLKYRENIEELNNQYSADAGAEIVYFLLHMFDRFLFEEFGPEVRGEIFDKVSIRTIAQYGKGVLKPDTPSNIVKAFCISMMNTLNDRQKSYSKCSTLCSKGDCLSAKGTTLFALNFYIHKALRKTNRKDLDENLLSGKRDIDISEMSDFPELQNLIKWDISSMATLIEIKKLWNSFFKMMK